MPEVPYPRQQTNSFANMSIGDLINTARGGLALQGDKAAGDIVQQNINPQTGVFDQVGAMRSLATNPNAAFRAPTIAGDIIERSKAQAERDAGMNAAVTSLAGALAGQRDPRIIRGIVLSHARNNPGIPSSFYANIFDTMPGNPKDMDKWLTEMRVQSLGPAGAAAIGVGPTDREGRATQETVADQQRALSDSRSGTMQPSSARPVGVPLTAAQSGQQLTQAQANNSRFLIDRNTWDQMRDLLNKGIDIGPGFKGRQELSGLAYSLSPALAKALQLDPEKIARGSEFEKYATNLVTELGTFAPGSDQQLATAVAGRPNTKIIDLAAKDLIKVQYALNRSQYILNRVAEEGGFVLPDGRKTEGGSVNFSKDRAVISPQLDPRAMAYDMMTPDELKKLSKSLKGAERDRFNRTLRLGIEMNVIPAGILANAAQ